MNSPKNQKNVSLPKTIRQDWSILVFRILGVSLALGLPAWQVLAFTGIFEFLILFITTGFLLSAYLYFWWLKNRYTIDWNKIIHNFGVFWTRQKVLRFPSLDKMRLKQSFLGKIFNYGTIMFLSSETNEKMTLEKIPNPRYYLNLLRQTMPGPEQF